MRHEIMRLDSRYAKPISNINAEVSPMQPEVCPAKACIREGRVPSPTPFRIARGVADETASAAAFG